MIILENDMDVFEESLMNEHYAGTVALSNIKKNPLSVIVANNEGVNYIASSSIENYMEANDMIDVEEAVNYIAEANNISTNSIVVVVDEANEYTIESLDECGIMLERAAEADATNLKKAMKWYNKFVNKSKGKANSKQELKDRINVLKHCKENMEKALRDTRNGKQGGRIKYTLKQLIPFNSIYRLIKHQDVYVGLGVLNTAINALSFVVGTVAGGKIGKSAIDAVNGKIDFDKYANDAINTVDKTIKYNNVASVASRVTGVGGLVLRATQYEKMLETQIKNTSEAIDFLEKKLKEWDD